MNRRGFMKGMAAGWVYINSVAINKAHALALPKTPSETLAETLAGGNIPSSSPKKIIWILLRGGLDGLHTVVPTTDTDIRALRPHLMASVQDQLLPLNGDFGLHPNLPFLHKLYQTQQMTPIIATASNYRQRSHFDAQDQMESGLNVTEHGNGWLARAVHQYSGKGMAIARSVPIALRDPQRKAETWYPSGFPEVEDDLLSRLSDAYQDDVELGHTLSKVIKQNNNPNMQVNVNQKVNFVSLAENCGKIIASNPDVCSAMLEFNGWDTHINQASRLASKFTQLDTGLKKLHLALGDIWDDTLIIINSEFGRTVAENGTSGTDHGTAGCMMFAGGSLANVHNNSLLPGGQVLGRWPGGSVEQLYQARDLQPTSDVRTWLGHALQQQWAMTTAQVNQVFPDLLYA